MMKNIQRAFLQHILAFFFISPPRGFRRTVSPLLYRSLTDSWGEADVLLGAPPFPLWGAGGGSKTDEEKLAMLPKWLCLGNGVFDICLADKTRHQIWGREGQCPCYQIGMVWHLVWCLPVLSGDREAHTTRRQCWGGRGGGEIAPFWVLACNPRCIKSWSQMKSEWKMNRICCLNKKRLSDFLFNCPDIWLASGEAPGIKSAWVPFLVHFLSVASLIKWNQAWDKCPISGSVKGMQRNWLRL